MQNGIDDEKERVLSETELEKVITTLLEIEGTDDRMLYMKIKAAIAKKRAERRRKRLRLGGIAASVAAVVIMGAIWFTGGSEDEVARASGDNGVRLTVSDGRNFDLLAANAPDSLLAEQNVLMKTENGTLYIESDEAEPSQQALSYNTLEVLRGRQYDIVLNDGTHVWLNSDSRLRFPASFAADERRVFVEGEAYFEVAHDQQRAFIVDMGAQTVTVLGTEFNVQAYADQPYSVTTLLSGSVRVLSKESNAEALLVPGQQSSLDNFSGDIQVREVDINDALAWKMNVINLEKRTLEEITSYLARIYDVEFRFMDDAARNVRYRGNVTRSQSVDTVLLRLGEVSGIKFRNKGNEIEIYMK